MAITAETRNDIIELVVTAYNAAPGTTLLTELVAIVDGGGSLADVAASLTTSARWMSLYPSFQTSEEFANEWLGNLVPEASAEALAEGVTVAVGLLNGGASFADLIMEAQGFLSAAAEDDASFGTSAANFNNKVEVATNHTVTLEKDGTEDELANVLSTVTSDDTTVTAANESEAATATGGETYTLTSKIDNITGTTSDDTINGIFSATAAEESYNLTDTIDGGAGTDTLNVNFILSADVTRTGQSANNVEVVNIKSTDGNTTSNTATFTISGIVGETQVWVRDNTVIGSNDDTITVNSITSGATLGLANNDSDLDVNFTTTGTATSADTVELAVAGGSTGDVVINDGAGDGYATINLTTSGSAASLSSLKSTDLTTLNILGDQKFTSVGLDSDITTLDASANTAGVTVNATAGSKLKATGSAATDTLALTVGSSVVSGMAVAGFETVSFYASASATVDMDQFTDVATTAFSSVTGAHGNTLTLNDVGANPVLAFPGAGKSTSTGDWNGVTVNLKDSSGTSDSVTFSLTNLGVSAGTNDAEVGALTAAGVETVNIVADDFDDLTINNATFAAAKTINYSGSADTNFGTLSTAALTSFAGSSATGDLTLGTVNNSTIDSTIATGSGKDAITTPTAITAGKTMTINTGAGNDTVTLQDSTTGVGATAGELGTVDLDTGDGTDTVTLTALVTGGIGDVNFKLDGGAGDQDLFQITAAGGAGGINIDEFDNFEKINLLGGQNNAIGLTVPTGYADTVLVTNVMTANTATITVNATTGGSASLSKMTFLGTVPTLILNGTDGGAETLTGTAQAQTIDGGTGADTMTGGAGVDTYAMVAGDTGTPSATNFDTITNYTSGTDIIDETGTALTLVAEGSAAAAGQASISATGLVTFNAADDTLAEKIVATEAGMTAATAAAGESAVFVEGSDSYVFISDGVAGVGANDLLIKITGIAVATGLTVGGGNITAIA